MSLPDSLTSTTVAVLGGTGPQGRGLARRFAQAGLTVVLGSRTAEKGAAAAAELSEAIGVTVTGSDNRGASKAGDIVRLVQTPGPQGEVSGKKPSPVTITATVVRVTPGETQTVVDVLVSQDRAAELAARAATGKVALVLDSRER